MIGFIGRRILQSIPTLILISLLLFFGMQAVPGGPLSAFAFRPGMSNAARQAIVHQWGLDQPVYIQYVQWVKSMVTGNWQFSFFMHRSVREVIFQRLPATAILMVTAYVIQQLIALPAGIIAALRRYSFFDQAVTFFSYVGYSMPTFWLGLMLLLIFAVMIPILPVAGIIDIRAAGAPFLTADYNAWFGQHPIAGILDILSHIVLPATTIAIVGIAGDSRFMRSSMLDAIHQDYVRTARAKGLSERVVVLKHALRNALLPVVTNIGIELPLLFSGAVVTEAIFSWPGMGQLFFQALEAFDYPLLMGILSVSAVLIILFNLLADIAYAYIDPRISYA
ncbi:MAG TPA: ABC transporter permease [Candidatus Dormibacteraeota bacterium]|nr:ABC transporter permease [Candidatus Dormibacteraeota bacterium]